MPALLRTTQIQEPSSASVNLTLDTSGNGTFAGTSVMSSPYTMRNKIINGAMVIDQRNAGASVTPTSGQYLVDRWVAQLSQASKFSVQQNAGSVTLPSGFSNYLGATSLSAYSVLSTDSFNLQQKIEGYNMADLNWGTVNAQTVTLSFKVYSSLTGTFGGSILNNAADRSYPFSYSIPSANTWTTISITVPGDTTGTWLTNNGVGAYVNFCLGAGSTYSGTSGSWAGAFYFTATGATSVVGTNGATFYITGVQLERGTVATPFEYRNYQQELAMCQRYYQYIGPFGKGVSADYWPLLASVNSPTGTFTNWYFQVRSIVTMRSSPTFGSSALATLMIDNGSPISLTSIGVGRMNADGGVVYATTASTTGNSLGNFLSANNSSVAYISFSAEL